MERFLLYKKVWYFVCRYAIPLETGKHKCKKK